MVTTPWYGFRGEFEPDPLTYDPPAELRGKLCYLIEKRVKSLAERIRTYDEHEDGVVSRISSDFEIRLKEAFGLPRLRVQGDFRHDYQNFTHTAASRDCIRAIEVVTDTLARAYLRYRNQLGEDWYQDYLATMSDDINKLFRLHSCGYQIETSTAKDDGPLLRVIRTDLEFLYEETVRRPLALLRDAEFNAAAKQFEDAVKEWSDENYRNAITDANAAFESVMKTILSKGSGNAHDLVKELVKRGYLPPYMESGANQLVDMLEMLPRLRDKEGDVHGKTIIEEEHLANYARLAINLSGSLIVFLVNEQNRKKEASPTTSTE